MTSRGWSTRSCTRVHSDLGSYGRIGVRFSGLIMAYIIYNHGFDVHGANSYNPSRIIKLPQLNAEGKTRACRVFTSAII